MIVCIWERDSKTHFRVDAPSRSEDAKFTSLKADAWVHYYSLARLLLLRLLQVALSSTNVIRNTVAVGTLKV